MQVHQWTKPILVSRGGSREATTRTDRWPIRMEMFQREGTADRTGGLGMMDQGRGSFMELNRADKIDPIGKIRSERSFREARELAKCIPGKCVFLPSRWASG